MKTYKKFKNMKIKLLIVIDLFYLSEFKISLHQDLIIIYIKYHVVTHRCDNYSSRSISHNDVQNVNLVAPLKLTIYPTLM